MKQINAIWRNPSRTDGSSWYRTEEIDALYDWEENVGIPETGNHLRITESYTSQKSL